MDNYLYSEFLTIYQDVRDMAMFDYLNKDVNIKGNTTKDVEEKQEKMPRETKPPKPKPKDPKPDAGPGPKRP